MHCVLKYEHAEMFNKEIISPMTKWRDTALIKPKQNKTPLGPDHSPVRHANSFSQTVPGLSPKTILHHCTTQPKHRRMKNL